MVRSCPECHLRLPLDQFVPRHNRDINPASPRPGYLPPPPERLLRQSRCAACNRVYQMRRRFVLNQLIPRASQLHVKASVRKGSVYRVIEVTAARAAPSRLAPLRKLVEQFNGSLPDERSVEDKHGVQLVRLQPKRTLQRSLF